PGEDRGRPNRLERSGRTSLARPARPRPAAGILTVPRSDPGPSELSGSGGTRSSGGHKQAGRGVDHTTITHPSGNVCPTFTFESYDACGLGATTMTARLPRQPQPDSDHRSC